MERIKWIDFNRGLLILLVVMAHSFCPDIVFSYISYILPGFLFISGLLYREKTLQATMKKLFLTLIIPYMVAGTINMIIWFTTKPMIPVPENDFTLSTVAINFLLMRTEPGQTAANLIPIWFLPLLFFTELFFTLMSRLRLIWPAIILGIISVNFFDGPLLWKLDVVPVALAFFSFGVFWKKRYDLKPFRNPFPVLIISLGIFFSIVYFNGCVDMNADYYGEIPLLFYPAGICIVLIFSALSQLLEQSRISGLMQFFGKNTIFILAYHITAAAMLYPLFELFGNAIYIATRFWYFYFLLELGLLTIMLFYIPEKLRLFLSGEFLAQRNIKRTKYHDMKPDYKSSTNS